MKKAKKLSLDLEYRFTSFEDFLGNNSTIKSLKAQLEEGCPKHSFLFWGPKGCGKTSLARLMAKELGCSMSAESLIEINTADTRTIDDARGIISKIPGLPMDNSPVKVFIIDEVHQATKAFQNAILKPLEEPPNHVYFFLCTTELNSIIDTVQSRCLSFQIKSVLPFMIRNIIRRILIAENKEIDPSVLKLISDECGGSPRNAIVLLEKVINIKDPQLAKEIITVEGIYEKEVIDIGMAIIKKDMEIDQVYKIIGKIKEDPETVRNMLVGFLTKCFLRDPNKEVARMIKCFLAPYYTNGKTRLYLSCFEAMKGE